MADPRRPVMNPGMDPDQSFLDRLGIVRPRNGAVGVSRVGGITAAAPDQGLPRPVPAPGVSMASPGRPASAAPIPNSLTPPPTPPPGPGGFIPPPPGGNPREVRRGPLDRRLPGARPPAVQTGRRVAEGVLTAPGTTGNPGTTGQVVTPPGGVIIPPPGGGGGGRGTPPGPRPGPGTAEAAVTQDSMGRVFQPARVALPKMPSRSELAQYPVDVAVDVPYGQLIPNEVTGERELVFSPEGKQLWAQETERIYSKLGPSPVAHDPKAPRMEVTPGKIAFNPFTNRFVS